MTNEMTAEEAVRELKILREEYWDDDGYGHETQQYDDTITAIDMAIKALDQRWIPVSEKLPKDFGTYLITLENGDVCKCEFNPDYIDEEHDKGAFTYYHDYFDNYTLGFIDSEEIAVDAIAWMPFEPYRESEDAE